MGSMSLRAQLSAAPLKSLRRIQRRSEGLSAFGAGAVKPARSSPEMNLVLWKLCLLLLFDSPRCQCAVEVSVANRNGALAVGGISSNFCRRYAPVQV
jgi:hypothetical protein